MTCEQVMLMSGRATYCVGPKKNDTKENGEKDPARPDICVQAVETIGSKHRGEDHRLQWKILAWNCAHCSIATYGRKFVKIAVIPIRSRGWGHVGVKDQEEYDRGLSMHE